MVEEARSVIAKIERVIFISLDVCTVQVQKALRSIAKHNILTDIFAPRDRVFFPVFFFLFFSYRRKLETFGSTSKMCTRLYVLECFEV